MLDYNLANKWDKGQTTVRRQFAASWLWSGKSIKNISKKERKIVRSYVKKYFGDRKPSGPPCGSADAARCRAGRVSLRHGNGTHSRRARPPASVSVGMATPVGFVATRMGPFAPSAC